MDVCTSLVCPCNNREYKNQSTLKAHQKTDIHAVWKFANCIKVLEVRNKQYENDLAHERRVNRMLSEQIEGMKTTIENLNKLL